MRGAVHVDPLIGAALQTADAVPDRVIQNLGAAAGDGIETRIAQPGDGVPQRQPADFGDVRDFGRGEAVAPDVELRFDGAEQVLVPLDLEVRVQAALEQDAGAAEVDGLLNFVEDHFAREDVAFLVAHRTVERAEAAVLGAEVGVVDVAIDDVGHHAVRMMLPANGVGFHAKADEVVGMEHVDGFSAGDHRILVYRLLNTPAPLTGDVRVAARKNGLEQRGLDHSFEVPRAVADTGPECFQMDEAFVMVLGEGIDLALPVDISVANRLPDRLVAFERAILGVNQRDSLCIEHW